MQAHKSLQQCRDLPDLIPLAFLGISKQLVWRDFSFLGFSMDELSVLFLTGLASVSPLSSPWLAIA